MNRDSTGFGRLVYQPQYIPSDTRLARHAAPYYRPIIYLLTTMIVLVTMIKYRQAPPALTGGLFFAMVVYTLIFLGRRRLNKAQESYFYRPKMQFLRGQASLLGVTVMVFWLAHFGYYDHTIWLLYVLATLIISEHNSTTAVLWTLIEVALCYLLASYIGWGIYTQNWGDLWAFWEDNAHVGVHILGIWLITFVFHYLVRNIHGRDNAIAKQQNWLNLIIEESVQAEEPQNQRQALVKKVENFTGGQASLWLKRHDRFLNDLGLEAPERLVQLASQQRPIILRRDAGSKMSAGDCYFMPEPPTNEGSDAQILIPIPQQELPHELLGILEIVYVGKGPGHYQIEMDCENLLCLMQQTRLVLLHSIKSEQRELVWSLSSKLHRLVSVSELAEQVTNDVVDKLGFDFATVSLVDDDENLIRGIAGREAEWFRDSIHALTGDDIQSQVVRELIICQNDGSWDKSLDGRIWNKYRHGQISRVWVPIPDPSENPPYPALGTITAGFRHEHRKMIPPDAIRLLDHYARHVGLALANAELHQRTCELANQLTTLQSISREMQQATAFFEPYQMIQLIGESAEKLLDAQIIMLYTFEENNEHLTLTYQTQRAITGNGELYIGLKSPLLNKLYTTRVPYYSTQAQQDPILVNKKEDGRLRLKERTFTQRQNIKSVAGIPLIGKRNNLLGFLCINYRRHREFGAELRQMVELFAEQASVALEETYSHRLSRHTAVAQERYNLGAELHHALSQELFGLKQYADTAHIYAQRLDFERAQKNLDNVRDSASSSLQALQEMLNYLHEYKNGEINFASDLAEYIERIKKLRREVNIQLYHQTAREVPNQVQFYLLRIAREAINNALRHGQCHLIEVSYSVAENGLAQLTIHDDGIGFNVVKARKNGHYGLDSMEYYARQINSNVLIDSQDGYGTCIRVSVSLPSKGA